MMTIGSLFSGVGGFDKGFEDTGQFKVIWNCEIEAYPSAVLEKHWSGIPNLGDVTKVNWESVQRPDILLGSPPCQDISNAGKKAGISGSRSILWKEYAKAIRILRPRYAVVENVSALAIRGLDVILADIAQIGGYEVKWFDLRASDVGAPHRRERIFIIAYLAHPDGIRHDGRNPMGQRQAEHGAEIEGRSYDPGAFPNPQDDGQPFSGSSRSRWAGLEDGSSGADVADAASSRGQPAEQPRCGNGIEQGRKAMADSHAERQQQPQGSVQDFRRRVGNSGEEMADSERKRFQERRRTQPNQETHAGFEHGGKNVAHASPKGLEKAKQQFERQDSRRTDSWRAIIGRLGRSDPRISSWLDGSWEDGIPRTVQKQANRVNRIKCLGNSVVPQCAQVVAERVLEIEREHT